MDPSNANPEEAGGLTHPQGPEPHTALTKDPVRSRCRIHCSAVNPDFKYTSPSHTLVKQVFFKFLLEVRSKALSSGLKRHVVVLELYDVARGMLHMRQQLLLYRSKKCQELLVLATMYYPKSVRLCPAYKGSLQGQTAHVPP